MTYDIGVFTRRRIISPAESYFAVPAAVGGAYVGPGDIAAGAIAWWGLRAYTAAVGAAGTNAIRIRDSTTTTERDIPLTSAGGLNAAEIALALPGGHTGTVVKCYDQTGNGHDITQATAASQPDFLPTGSVLGTLPVMSFDGTAHGRVLTAVTTITQACPYSSSFVAMGSFSSEEGYIISADSATLLIGYALNGAGDGNFGYYDGDANSAAAAAADDVFHAGLGVNKGAGAGNLILRVDTATGINTALTVNQSGVTFAVGARADLGGNTKFKGKIAEAGFWPGDISSAYNSTLRANQATYWGF